jgi:hypothetical protein
MLAIAVAIVAIPSVFAAENSGDFTSEPDKTMAAAHESFVKKDTDAAARHIHDAATYVEEESKKVADGSKEDVRKAGHELEKLGNGVKDGSVKSADELTKTFAKVDHALAKAGTRPPKRAGRRARIPERRFGRPATAWKVRPSGPAAN